MLNDVKPTDPAVFLGNAAMVLVGVDGRLLHPGALGRPCRSGAGPEKRLTLSCVAAMFTVYGNRRIGGQEEVIIRCRIRWSSANEQLLHNFNDKLDFSRSSYPPVLQPLLSTRVAAKSMERASSR